MPLYIGGDVGILAYVRVTFWGTRGSIATPGASTLRYGGNTSCVQAVTDTGTLLIFDSGTGIRPLGDHLIAVSKGPIKGHIFLTHTHWDHIQGFPFFAPVFVHGNEWTVYGPLDGERGLEQALAGQMQYAYFPVELDEIGSALSCVDLSEGVFHVDGVRIDARYLNHPAVTLGYRVQVGGATLVYSTDHEPFSPVLFRQEPGPPTIDSILHAGDRAHAEFLVGADLLIHDAQYTSEEYELKRTWGHSTIEYVVQIALVAGVKRLVLFHHEPKHDDLMLDELQRRAREMVPEGRMEVSIAREGDWIELAEHPEAASRRGHQPNRPTAVVRPRVILIEDDPMVRDLVRDILEADGYVLDAATDGYDALAKINEHAPDLILLDMRLPRLDGFEVLERIRALPSTHGVPVIMLTAAADEESIDRGFGRGADDYMTKPFAPAQLRARISGWLQRSADHSAPAV